ncbi:putative peptidase/beta-mannanase [Paenibacillus endophyticus]|uniref:Putative peptidase/beta-mannanase n=1 Tax=Paenibacillus endophyticus TaxID=1294268 RepID=A0A7W5CAG5_9BACL|nr:glycosyl hydrolase [Paenibacillus endophyticus]MBB3154100.1 putative peptidase/beta-mannanase [Paenibacillus endophyticus]
MRRKRKLSMALSLLLSLVMVFGMLGDAVAVLASEEPSVQIEGLTDDEPVSELEQTAQTAGSTSVFGLNAVHPSSLGDLNEDFKVVLDDYNDASASNYNLNPSVGSISFVESPFGQGLGKAMQFSYSLSQGYNGVIHRRDVGGLPLNGVWKGLSAIELWVQLPAPAQSPILQLNIGDAWPGTSYEVDLKKHAGFDSGSASPQHLVIPIDQFLLKGGAAKLPSTENVISFSMYLGGSGTGNAFIDEVKLIFAEEVAIDEFDVYADDEALSAVWASNSSGGMNAKTLVASASADGGKAMSFAYDAAAFNSAGYTGAVKSVAGQDWTGTGAIGLWFTGDGLGQDVLLQITSGANASMEAHLNDLGSFNPESTEPQYLIIPLTAFKPKAEGMVLELKTVTGFGLYVNKTSELSASSSLLLDHLVRYVPAGSKPVGSDEVVFTSTSLTAQGSDSLLKVLNAHADVSDGGQLVGVSFESSNPAILANAEGYAYKGVFHSSGNVRIKLKSVLAQINGAVKEIAIDGEITIEVSNLEASVDVLAYLNQLSGNGLLTAMHNKEPNTNPRESTDRILSSTGVTPAIWSGDFLYQARDVAARQTMIDEAIRQWNDGSLVNMMLHVAPPNRTVEQEKAGSKWDDRAAVANQDGVQSYLSEAQWQSLLTDGGELNVNWKKRLDEYYRYLVQLKNAGVTVMFRPFHEMNQHVFWWAGNPSYTKALYRLTHDYLVDGKGLDNLIWVWDVQDLPAGYGDAYGYDATDWSAFDPGADYWDVFALDVYDAAGYTQSNYDKAVAAAGGKPMAIGECWVLPTQAELAQQPKWVFAMPWAGDTFNENSADAIKAFYQSNLAIGDTPRFQTRRVGTSDIENFEGYASQAALTAEYERDSGGGSNTVALQTSPFSGGGANGLSMAYNTSSASGYSGTLRSLNMDITGAKTIKMWFKGNGNSGQTVLVRLKSGAAGSWFEFDLLDLRSYDATSKQAQYLEIPIEAFKPLEKGTELDLASISGLGFYVKKLGGEHRSGTLLFDSVSYSTLAPAKEAPRFKVAFQDTDWTASGNDTLISLLKKNTTVTSLVPGNAGDSHSIFQVLYTSSSDDILRNDGLFSSKGVFRSEGEVDVVIKQVTIYSGNKQYVMDVNQAVSIDVGKIAEPVNILAYLKALTGKGTLSAMHNKEPNERPRITTDRIMETTGVTPAIWSGDFLFLRDDVANRQKMIDEAIRQWNDGALINLMFHVTSPVRTVAEEKEGADWSGSSNAVQTNLTAAEWESLLTDGGELNSNWKLRLNEYAAYLQQLEDAGVVPMIRPFHEMNQHAFWWAGIPENTAALYRLTKDYLVNEKGLDNLIWMWNVQDFDNRLNWNDYNPGNEYWDVLTLDAYTNGLGSKGDQYYAQMRQYAADAGGSNGPKPIGIGESFKLLNAAGIAKYSDYVMMMPWADDAWVYNTDEELRGFYKNTLSILDTPVFASTVDGGSGAFTETFTFDLVTEVQNWGQNVKGVVIDMGTEMNASDLDTNTFEVSAKHTTSSGTTAFDGLRTIAKAYVNNSGQMTGTGTETGRYAILEFKMGRDLAEASTTAWDSVNRLTTLLTLDYTVKQKSAFGTKLAYNSSYMFKDQINLIVDEFAQGTYSDDNGEHAYNLFTPKAKQAGEKYPLVVWLHGNGERGSVGEMPLLSSKGAIAFAEPAAQAAYGGMYVLAPQFSAAHGASDDIVDGANALVKKLIASDSQIDPSRIYLLGGSAGGTRVWKMLLQEPGLYAAAVPICSTTTVPGNLDLSAGDYDKLTKIPLWLFHAANDGTIGAANSRKAYEELSNRQANVKYTEFANMVYNGVTYDGHHSWVPVLDNYYDETYGIKTFDWLFAQSLEGEAGDYRMVLDDFSSYASSAELANAYARNTNGGANTVELVKSPFGESMNNAMAFTYSLTNGYSGRSHPVNGYWPGLKAIELWIQNDALGQDILLQLSDGASYELHLNQFAGFDAASTAPQHLTIPIEAFKRKEGSGSLNTKGIVSFALYVNQVAGGAGGKLTLDEISLVFDQKPDLPEIAFESNNVQADGVGNLISLLNNNASVPDGGKIVQVSYASTNEAVLPNRSGFVPKGDFLSEGSTSVMLKQAKLYLDGTTYTIDVNAELQINVSKLPQAVDVVQYLKDLTGKGMLSAMHHDQSYANPGSNDVLHQRVANEFGVYPALYSADFLTGGTVQYRQNMINEVIRQWNNGNLVQIMFHVSPPQYTVQQESEGNWGGDQAHETMPSPNRIFSYLYNDQWKELMTEGTPLNTNWKLRMDEYAKYLQQLEDAGVTIMLRPFHEMNQHVFWWGGRPGEEGSAQLYRMFHDYMEKEKGLSNIVWVWNIQDLPDNYGFADGDAKFDRYEGIDGGLAEYDANDWSSFSPGKQYYDVLSVDFYDVGGYATRYYEQAKRIADADGKPLIIGETFVFPTQAEQSAQPDWTIAMPWGVRTWNYNSMEAMAEFYQNSIGTEGMPRFTTRDNSVTPVDRSELEEQLAEAALLIANDYTSSTWEALSHAVAAAKEVLGNTGATQDEVNHALQAVKAAYDGLVRAGGSSSGGGAAVDSAIKVGIGSEAVSIPYSLIETRVVLTVTDSKLSLLLAKASAEASFDLSAVTGAASVEVAVSVLQKLAESKKGAAFKLPSGTVSLDFAALLGAAKQAAGQSVTITLEAVNTTKLTAEQLKAAGSNKIYDISMSSGGRKITSFEGQLTIALPYVLKKGESGDGVAIWYLDELGKLSSVPGLYDADSQTIRFSVDHLSYYVVGYDETAAWSNPFLDVKKGQWFYDSVSYVVQDGLFSGVNAKTFDPKGQMTRAMLVTVLYRLAGEPAAVANRFTDVASGSWYETAAAWADEQGIVTGYGNGRFGPQDAVTREQMVAILYRYATLRGYAVANIAEHTAVVGAEPQTAEHSAFADLAQVSDWAQEAMRWAVEAQLITGKTGGLLDPQGKSTRAEVAALLHRFADRIVQ